MEKMYTYKEEKPCELISRKDFVNKVFFLGYLYEHNIDSMITSVQLGDEQSNGKYSKELAHAVTVIVGKLNNECYASTHRAIMDCDNYSVRKLVVDICRTKNFCISIKNFLTVWSTCLRNDYLFERSLHTEFVFLCKEICQDKTLLNMNPATLLLGMKLLSKRNKLKASRAARFNYFTRLCALLSEEYQIPLCEILRNIKN